MIEPVNYLTVVGNVLKIYQEELIALFKNVSVAELDIFKRRLDEELKRLKEVEESKSIEKNIMSQICQPMVDYLTAHTRAKKTSQSQRLAMRSSLMSQDGHRMRFTGGLKKKIVEKEMEQVPIIETSQMDEIIRSYRIQEEIGPRMRMKWRSLRQNEEQSKGDRYGKQKSTIGDNNIDLLSYTIPQIQNSIKRLSLQSSQNRQRSPQRLFQSYRTIETRNHSRKKYVSRLI